MHKLCTEPSIFVETTVMDGFLCYSTTPLFMELSVQILMPGVVANCNVAIIVSQISIMVDRLADFNETWA